MTSTVDMTTAELVNKTMQWPYGCEDGKLQYLRECLGISHPEDLIVQPLTLQAEFQYRSMPDNSGMREARSRDAVNSLLLPGVGRVQCTGDDDGDWTTGELRIDDPLLFVQYLGGIGQIEKALPDDSTWMRLNFTLQNS
jgi:hypothetical protein